MSPSPQHHIETIKGAIQIYANQVIGADGHTTDAKIDMLSEFIKDKNKSERMVVFCDNIISCHNTKLALLGKGIESSVFNPEINEENLSSVNEGKNERIHDKLCICSYSTSENVDLTLIENFVFLEMPSEITRFPKTLNRLEESWKTENRVICVEIILSSLENPDMMNAVVMEMEARRNIVPLWLAEYMIVQFARKQEHAKFINVEDEQDQKQINMKPDEVSKTASAPATNSRKRKMDDDIFDPYNMKPNAEGKCVIPAQFCAQNYDSSEEDEIDDENGDGYDSEHEYVFFD